MLLYKFLNPPDLIPQGIKVHVFQWKLRLISTFEINVTTEFNFSNTVLKQSFCNYNHLYSKSFTITHFAYC